jgi:hypothetical protein
MGAVTTSIPIPLGERVRITPTSTHIASIKKCRLLLERSGRCCWDRFLLHHLSSLVCDMGIHRGQPPQGTKDLLFFAAIGSIDHFGLLGQIGHPLLRKRGTDHIRLNVAAGPASS